MTALNEKAMLVSLDISYWRATTTNRRATDTAAASLSTSAPWLGVTGKLIPKETLEDLRRIVGQARNYLDGKSVGAADGKYLPGGLPHWEPPYRILPSSHGFNERVLRNLGAFKDKFNEEVEKIRRVLPDAIEQAKRDNPEIAGQYCFPPVDDIIAEKFGFQWQLDIIPDSGDIRVEASKEFVAELRASVNERANSKLNEVTAHTVRTVIEVARHLADSLDQYDPDDKAKSPFRDSTVDRVRDLVPVIRALNINADAQIDKAVTDLLAAVGNKSAKQLRTDTEDRKATAAAARKVADNIDSIFN
jgi:hypothetical protein